MRVEILVEGFERAAADFSVAQLAVARRVFELGQQVEGDVGGLVIFRIGAGNVSAQRSDRSFAWKRGMAGSDAAGDQPGGDRFDVAFDAGNLAGEKNIRRVAELKSGREQRGAVDISVAM